MFNNLAFETFIKSFENADFGEIEITSPEGKKYYFQGNKPGVSADIHIKSFDVIASLIAKGDIGFAEDYRDGKWESNCLKSLFFYAIQNEQSLNSYIHGTSFYKMVANIIYLFRRNTLKGSKNNISAHYDLGNDFYKLWLDDSMTYSAAIFKNNNEHLLSAQHNKYDRILDRIGSNSSDILEVGCGWGGFAERAITRKDHRIKGITLSNEQHDYANQRLKNYSDNTKIVLEDYRKQEGKFDNIVSIEMFEAVGEKFWPTYFSKLSSLLKPKGRAVIQTITIHNDQFESYRKRGDFIRSFIFPGGMLPSENKFEKVAGDADLKVTDKFLFGKDYSLTLNHWLSNFDSKIEEVKKLGFDDKFIRIWRLYLASCVATFASGKTGVMQVELQHA